MNLQLIEDRIKKLEPQTQQDEKNAFRQAVQEIALSALAKTDFFHHAALIGGGCLRLVHGVSRFSEDLDFWTIKPSLDFQWKPYLKIIQAELETYAIHIEIEEKAANETIGKAVLHLPYGQDDVHMKFQIETNPPHGAHFETKKLDFPHSFFITTLDKPSLFASKLGAMLERKKKKGRYWYDFLFYVVNMWPMNCDLLSHILQKKISLSNLQKAMAELIGELDFNELKEDVRHLISFEEQKSLALWNKEFFLRYVEALDYLS